MSRVPSRFDRPEDSPGFLLWQVSNAWQRRQRASLRPLGLTHAQFVLLMGVVWLEKQGEPVSQRRLAHFARADAMMTSEIVRALVGRRLIARKDDPRDRRAFQLQATPTGRALALRALRRVEDVDGRFFQAAGAERAALVRALQRVSEAARKEESSDDSSNA
jgi:DNA-binding MarR family transcriptional regulator